MRILSVDGGGYLGLATAAFLDGLESHFGSHCRDRFDLFCGTSTGAIIALGLAAGKSGAEIVELFERMGPRVFPPSGRMGRFFRKAILGAFSAQYASEPLRAALQEAFGDLKLGDLRVRGKHVLVASFCVSSGQPRLFKTDHSANLTTDDGYFLRDVALASSAAPTYLPMVELTNPKTGSVDQFCDGGVFANAPALLGYAEAIYELRAPSSEVSLLSVSTPMANLAEYASAQKKTQRLNRGYWRWKDTLANVTIDGTTMISSRALQRILKVHGGGAAQYSRIELERAPGLDIDVAGPAATQTLRSVGASKASQNDVRSSLVHFFRD